MCLIKANGPGQRPSSLTAIKFSCAYCRFTTYRHRFARVAPAPLLEQSSSKNRGRASPVKNGVRARRARRALVRVTARQLPGCAAPLYVSLCLTFEANLKSWRWARGAVQRFPPHSDVVLTTKPEDGPWQLKG